jgi:hypothetical protein
VEVEVEDQMLTVLTLRVVVEQVVIDLLFQEEL